MQRFPHEKRLSVSKLSSFAQIGKFRDQHGPGELKLVNRNEQKVSSNPYEPSRQCHCTDVSRSPAADSDSHLSSRASSPVSHFPSRPRTTIKWLGRAHSSKRIHIRCPFPRHDRVLLTLRSGRQRRITSSNDARRGASLPRGSRNAREFRGRGGAFVAPHYADAPTRRKVHGRSDSQISE